ncbi:MAG: outer membrane beta-barrel protein [Myxococcota bacterium]
MPKPSILALLAAALALPAIAPSAASAQCANGATVCADVSVSASASVSIGRRPRRRAQVVQVQAPPPPPPRGRVLVVQPAPPAPPPQQVVVVQPPPPQPVQEQVVIIEQDTNVRVTGRRAPKLGLTARIGSLLAEDVRMGGLTAGLRFRPSRIFGVELSIGAFGGSDYYDRDRVEVPVSFDFMFHFPRASRFQAYALIGSHFSWARAEGFDPVFGPGTIREFRYFGGQIGLGMEYRLNRHFAVSADIRGFIRTRIDNEFDAPEFVNATTGETTDTSAGALVSLGAHFYF